MRITATYLGEHPRFMEPLARRQAALWSRLYRAWDAATALREFREQHSDGSLPTTLVAMEDGELRGSISLVFDDLPEAGDLNPWVASLFVPPEWRGRGVGGFLLGEAERLLAAAGVRRAYAFSENAQVFFLQHGWTFLRRTTANGFPVDLLTRILPESS